MNNCTVSIGLLNPKSPENVDSVTRAAGNYSVDAIYYTGQRYPRALARNPGTPNLSRSISDGVAVMSVEQFSDELPPDCKLICIELAENATPLPDYQHPENACYIFGPEDGSISQEIINQADAVVYIPTKGCMNLAATVNVVLYDRLAKSADHFHGNALIRKSRDRNNNLKA